MERLDKGAILALVDRARVTGERSSRHDSLDETAVGGIPTTGFVKRLTPRRVLKNLPQVQTVVEKNFKPQHPKAPRVLKGIFQRGDAGIGRQDLQAGTPDGIRLAHGGVNCSRKDRTLSQPPPAVSQMRSEG